MFAKKDLLLIGVLFFVLVLFLGCTGRAHPDRDVNGLVGTAGSVQGGETTPGGTNAGATNSGASSSGSGATPGGGTGTLEKYACNPGWKAMSVAEVYGGNPKDYVGMDERYMCLPDCASVHGECATSGNDGSLCGRYLIAATGCSKINSCALKDTLDGKYLCAYAASGPCSEEPYMAMELDKYRKQIVCEKGFTPYQMTDEGYGKDKVSGFDVPLGLAYECYKEAIDESMLNFAQPGKYGSKYTSAGCTDEKYAYCVRSCANLPGRTLNLIKIKCPTEGTTIETAYCSKIGAHYPSIRYLDDCYTCFEENEIPKELTPYVNQSMLADAGLVTIGELNTKDDCPVTEKISNYNINCSPPQKPELLICKQGDSLTTTVSQCEAYWNFDCVPEEMKDGCIESAKKTMDCDAKKTACMNAAKVPVHITDLETDYYIDPDAKKKCDLEYCQCSNQQRILLYTLCEKYY